MSDAEDGIFANAEDSPRPFVSEPDRFHNVDRQAAPLSPSPSRQGSKQASGEDRLSPAMLSPSNRRLGRSKTMAHPWMATCKKCLRTKEPQALNGQPDNHLASKGLCLSCAASSDRQCAMVHCRSMITVLSEHWGSGLCDRCYDLFPQCKVCASRLKVKEVKFRTGLCNGCFDSCERNCSSCKEKLTLGQMGWRTGMCDDCFDKVTKMCQNCCKEISPEELGWRTGFCDRCYDAKKGCNALASTSRQKMGLCDACHANCLKTCVRCRIDIPPEELRWSSGICDACYKDTRRQCSICTHNIPIRQLRWNSGLCDKCYKGRENSCQMCKTPIGPKSVLCDACYGTLTSENEIRLCSRCPTDEDEKIYVGDPFWSIGLCSHCYMDGGRRKKQRAASMDKIYAKKSYPGGAADGAASAITFIYCEKASALQPKNETAPPWRWHQLLFLLVGVSAWLPSNITFAALPLFVEKLPQGANLASIVNASTQVGAIVSMTYYCIQVMRREDRSDSHPREAYEDPWLARKRASFKRQKKEKAGLTQAIKATHAGQCLAVMTLLVFGSYWRLQQSAWQIVVLSALTGIVGNMADLTVWPITLQYPGCAVAIQVGSTLSGLLGNFLEEMLGKYGISSLFFFGSALQLFLWLPLFYLTGTPRFDVVPFRRKRKGQCTCLGCDGCVQQPTNTAFSPASSNLLKEPLLASSSSLQSRQSEVHVDEAAAGSPSLLLLTRQISAGVVDRVQAASNLVGTYSHAIAQGGSDAAGGFCRSLELTPMELKDEIASADKAASIDIRLVWLCCISTFLVKAAGYSLPSLFPYLVLPYGAKANQRRIYQNVNAFYNAGNLIGRMLVQLYVVGKWTTIWTSACIFVSFLFIIFSTASPSLETVLVPISAAWWAIPSIVGTLNLSAGLLSTGLMVIAYERARDKNAPPHIKHLPTKMGFYGQFGCVSANILVYMATMLGLI